MRIHEMVAPQPRQFALFVILGFAAIARVIAQQSYLEQIGSPATHTTVPVELGSADLSNGNLHLEVPLGAFPQRGGLPYEAKLVYDSRIWIPGQWAPTFLQSLRPYNVGDGHGNYAMGGWRLVVTSDNTATLANSNITFSSCNHDSPPNQSSFQTRTNFLWGGPDGVGHIWQNLETNQDFVSPGSYPCGESPGNIPSASGWADDGSGFYLVVTNYQNMTVYAPDGTQVFPVFRDPNGNYVSNDASGNVIDTLGRIPVTKTVNGNNIYYDVLNAQGSRSRYTVTTESINVSVPNYSGTLTVIQSIGLPNGTSYSFGYDSGTSGDNWGGITSVTLPTGGQITYGYTTFVDAWAYANSTNRWVSSRTTSDGTWLFTPLAISHTNAVADQQITVKKPSGDYVIYKSHADCQLGPFKNKESDFYNAAGVLLKQQVIDYGLDLCQNTATEGAPITVAAPVIRLTTTVFGSSGPSITTKTEYDYANSPSLGNPTKISEWNYYTGTAPQTPDRIRQVTYSLTGNSTLAAAHINDKPLTVTLTDGASTPTQIAQTTFAYDNYSGNPLGQTDACQTTSASQPSPAAPQHDYQAYCASNTVRGNLTNVSKWLNTAGGSITTTTNTFDDTGNIVKVKDALSNPTTFGFSPSLGLAYVTSITNALGHVATKNYDFNTGLVTSETDANGQTTGLKTTYSYDGMGRLIETDFPDGGQIKTSFNGDAVPLTMTTTRLATPDPSIVRTTVLDGLGRTQTECLTDPEGNDCVDTTYDVNGRLGSKSNPHRTTAAASDGITYFYYGGLDRATSVTEPDGNTVSSSYDTQTNPVLGEVATTTDETGRQRRGISDGFGRLLEVDEPGDSFGGAFASGTLTISGSLQSTMINGHAATPGSGTVSVGGYEQSIVTTPPCDPSMNSCPPSFTTWDFGSVTVTVNGFAATYNYSAPDSSASVATGLTGALNSSSSPVHATQSGTTITVTSNAAGAASNYSLSANSTTGDPTDYSSPSFSAFPSGSSLTNGTDAFAGTPVTDYGTLSVNVGGFVATACYGPNPAPSCNGTNNSTAAQLASALVGTGPTGLNGPNSPVSASASGATMTIVYKTVGASGNITVSSTSQSTQTATTFSPPSFTSPGTTLAGGADPYASGLAHPYASRYFYDLLDNLTCIEQHGNTMGSGCTPAVLGPSSTPPTADASSTWRVRRFVYDSLSRLVWSNDPESGLSSNTYDNNGNLTSETDARGVTVNYSPSASPIDALNRVTSITYSDGTPTVTYKYDTSCCGVTSLNPLGRMTASYTGNTELVFSYEPMGRTLTHWDCPPSGIARGYCYVISAQYDLAGQMTSLTYPDGRVVTRSYSAGGRMTGVNLASFGGTAVNVPYYTVPQTQSPNSWGYWPGGEMNRGTFGNGIIQTTGYNNRTNISSITDLKGSQTLLSKTYGLYDASGHNNGNILSVADGLSTSANQTYTYDTLNRVISGSQADNTFNVTFNYDPWGNMYERGTSNFTPVYDTHNRIQNSAYDAAGNLLNDGLHTYAYDGTGRMKTVDGTGAAYTYNPVGNRVRKDTTSGSTEYFFFGRDIIAELNLSNNAWTDYVFGYGERVAKDTSPNGAGAQYLHSDQIDSTRLVTDSNGAVVWQATYNPFGQELSPQNNATFQFAGMQYDSEDGLTHTDYRQYASFQGRWLSPDAYLGSLNPANPQSLNRYVYVLDNPLKFRDPWGLDCIYSAEAAQEANLPGPGIVRGDCLSDKDGGVFVDGRVNTVVFNKDTGDTTYYYGDPAPAGSKSGTGITFAGPYDAVAAVTELERQAWEARRAKASASAADVPLNQFAQAVFSEVGRQTGWYTTQINCAAGFAYPFIPGLKPEDLRMLIGIEGSKEVGEHLESESGKMKELAKKLQRAKKKGTAAASREAARESEGLMQAAHLAKGVGYLFATAEGVQNWKDCQAGSDPE